MGYHPPHGHIPRVVPLPGGAADDGADTAEEYLREVGAHLCGNGKGGGGVPDIVGVHSEKTENLRAVQHYSITARTVGGGREGTDGTGEDVEVGSGRHKYGRGKGSDGGGRGGENGQGRVVMEGT